MSLGRTAHSSPTCSDGRARECQIGTSSVGDSAITTRSLPMTGAAVTAELVLAQHPGGLHELADAANVGFNVYRQQILIPEETQKICKHFNIDPLQLISSGSLLITAEKEETNNIIGKLTKEGIQAAVIGEITEPKQGRNLFTETKQAIPLVRPTSDHLWKALEKPDKHHSK